MQFGVDEWALAGAAGTADRTAAAVAAIRVDDLGRSVATAMPGSRSAGPAATVAEMLRATVQNIVRDLAQDAESVRTAQAWYRATDQDVAATRLGAESRRGGSGRGVSVRGVSGRGDSRRGIRVAEAA